MIELKNATITGAKITNDAHGMLSAMVYLDYGNSQQGFGGYVLYQPADTKYHKGQLNYAGHFIWRVLEIAGVEDWEQLVGKTIRVKSEHSKVHAIGHITKDIWFNPSEEFEKLGENDEP